MYRNKILVAVLCLFLVGCTSQFVKQLNHQNQDAARVIYEQTQSPIAKDIFDNSAEIKQHIGDPKEIVPYSTEKSKQIRDESKKQRETSWWGKFLGLFAFLGDLPMEAIMNTLSSFIPYLSTIGPALIAAWSLFKKWKADKKVMAGYKGVNDIMKAVKNGEVLTVEGLKTIMTTAQTVHNIAPDVIKDLQKLWKDNKLSKVE